MIRELTQIVLGIRNAMHYTYDRTYCDIGQEIADSADPEDAAEDRVIEVPVEWVIARTVRETYGECATYFTCLRDSLRNILLDADKCVEQRALIFSDAFWRKFILKAVQTKKTETLLWDFKQTLTMWEVRNDQERARAKVRVAEDVASLANARGGVLIIGVRDQPREIVGLGPIREIENRLMVANQVIVRHVEYDRELVSFRQVVIPGNGEIVCLVVVVAQVPLRGKQSRLK
jgi:hypothetical protein